jgi:hypothetical protein
MVCHFRNNAALLEGPLHARWITAITNSFSQIMTLYIKSLCTVLLISPFLSVSGLLTGWSYSFNSAKATYGRRCWLPVSHLLHKHVVLFYSLEPPLCTSQPRGHTGFDTARTRQPQWPTVLILHFFIFRLSSFLLLNFHALLPSAAYYGVHNYNQYTSVAQIFEKSRIRLNKQAREGWHEASSIMWTHEI